MGEWQPIETAPKDGTPILGFDARVRTPALSCDMAVMRWDVGGKVTCWEMWWGPMPNSIVIVNPSHWMPLPPAPPEEGEMAERERVTITLEQRGDGGLRVYSDDVRGLILSSPYPEMLGNDIIPALRVLKPELFAPLPSEKEEAKP